jgi:MFS family permease
VALTLPSLSAEFNVSEKQVRYTTCSLFVGLCIGASFWGVGSDVMGRRLAFNMTLFLAGVFGIAAGGGPNWVGTCGLFAALGTGVGGISVFHTKKGPSLTILLTIHRVFR